MFTVIDVSGNEDYAKDIFSLEEECFPLEYWSYESVCKNITCKNTICLICVYQETAVGYITASCVLDEAELERVAVSSTYRGKGIGKILIDNLIDILRKRGIARLMLEVRTKNTNAITLYKQCGFVTDTIRKNYYINPSDDALLMSLVI